MAACSVCERPNAAAVVDRLLDEKTMLDKISELTGIHRSSLFRHKQRCWVKHAARSLQQKRFDASRDRIIYVDRKPTDLSTFGEHDVVLYTTFSESEIKNPAALLKPKTPEPEAPAFEVPVDIQNQPLN